MTYQDFYDEYTLEKIEENKQETLAAISGYFTSNLVIADSLRLQEMKDKWDKRNKRYNIITSVNRFYEIIRLIYDDLAGNTDSFIALLKVPSRCNLSEGALVRCFEGFGINKVDPNHIVLEEGVIIRSDSSYTKLTEKKGIDVDFAGNTLAFPGCVEALITVKHTEYRGSSQNNQLEILKKWLRNAVLARKNLANKNIAFIAISDGEYGRKKVESLRNFLASLEGDVSGIYVMTVDELLGHLPKVN